MDLATVIGTVGNLILIPIVMTISGSLLAYWDLLSVIIVLGELLVWF